MKMLNNLFLTMLVLFKLCCCNLESLNENSEFAKLNQNYFKITNLMDQYPFLIESSSYCHEEYPKHLIGKSLYQMKC